mmetsp:Transcript_47606/g.101162  ORF Transcript_47606/g.101162 Transcript_47606/m.101162 type:complete len:114 (+) Transcript_47606:106-447(+)|eukprot:CAMPEP_0172557382 /NCGR_PEP_ID=MMETSP1067-20121228/72963_1 /TAXON_ID=265564 ORGANISM="Thalassiosira punctigera, Strain Tpunct2005C2" /NCGR_SAMPLE_ID=MMETSP1067 /ASSEMBLY_ACC=CAM_ASM_000444 /LENGTH=113 /DNA_ID=CAMNT_0013346453 /DNA_START=89 /DNA_END=430 /DNA_ORIENTATION=+
MVFDVRSAAVDATQYYYNPLGPWGLESTVINAKAIRKRGLDDLDVVKTTSRKTSGADKDKNVEEVKSDVVSDELEKAEEAFFHAVESVEHAVANVIDDEVETLFPHHKKPEGE